MLLKCDVEPDSDTKSVMNDSKEDNSNGNRKDNKTLNIRWKKMCSLQGFEIFEAKKQLSKTQKSATCDNSNCEDTIDVDYT